MQRWQRRNINMNGCRRLKHFRFISLPRSVTEWLQWAWRLEYCFVYSDEWQTPSNRHVNCALFPLPAQYLAQALLQEKKLSTNNGVVRGIKGESTKLEHDWGWHAGRVIWKVSSQVVWRVRPVIKHHSFVFFFEVRTWFEVYLPFLLSDRLSQAPLPPPVNPVNSGEKRHIYHRAFISSHTFISSSSLLQRAAVFQHNFP